MMGSVGVKQAEMAKHDIKSNRGNKRRRRPRRKKSEVEMLREQRLDTYQRQ